MFANICHRVAPCSHPCGKLVQILGASWQHNGGLVQNSATRSQHTNGNSDRNEDEKERLDQEKDPNATMYDGHIPTSSLQKLVLAGGSSIAALANPWRADMVAVNGEVTGLAALNYMLERMMSTPEGREVIEDRPRINKATLDSLSEMAPHTVGGVYYQFMVSRGLNPDDRDQVRFVDDPTLAYVMTRYRETHDLTHAVLDINTNMVGEVLVKWVEAVQTRLPMCVGGAIFGPLRFKSDRQRDKYTNMLPWALSVGHSASFLPGVYYEKRWDQNIQDFWRELNIDTPPHLAVDTSDEQHSP